MPASSTRCRKRTRRRSIDELWIWAELVFIFIVIAVYRLWLRQFLIIRWRRWLTNVYFRQWLGERTYYRMELTNHGTDNPEQRIERTSTTSRPRRSP